MVSLVLLVWAVLMTGGLLLFCGIARSGLQEDVRFTPRDPRDRYLDARYIPVPRDHSERTPSASVQ